MPAALLDMTRKVPIRLTWITNSNRSIGKAVISPVSRLRPAVLAALATPAQLTHTRSCPCAARALAKPASTLSSRVTSTWQNRPPNSAAAASPASALRSKTATFAPASARARAVASPRPDAPPVTTAARVPSMRMAFSRDRAFAQPRALLDEALAP